VIVKIKEFSSVEQIENALNKEMSEIKNNLSKHLQRLNEIRTLAEKQKKVREIVMKLAGKKTSTESLGEINMDGINVVLDANLSDELTALESVVRSHQKRLKKVQEARRDLKPLDEVGDTEGVKFLVVEGNGIPERILFKIC
jgi:Zn-dependent M32 family carboxypeptidase